MTQIIETAVDLERLFKLRVAVARAGEMDLFRWWNTRGQLGPLGSSALRRGLPRTHRFAQARSVFAVAAHRCRELFDPPHCVTLWSLPASVEEELDSRLEGWLDDAAAWEPFFISIERLRAHDLRGEVRALDLVTDGDLESASRLRRSAEGRAVAIPGVFSGSGADIAQLALGFGFGEAGSPVVPYMRLSP
ncbi:MAG TPA: BrxE family protein [Thermoanaerobaculia bacterium]|nr:BrxE family protein [Thermoanaerobaculia bacterium]